MALYRGADDGPKDKDGEAIGKKKLLNLATKGADGEAVKSELLEVYFEDKDAHNKRRVCEDLDYKYMITMDGDNSDFLQA